MSTQPQFTPAQQERIEDLCAWCANGVKVEKEHGEYVHMSNGRPVCAASSLRKQLEKTPLERMKECWNADKCPIDGHPKRARKDWFCVGCWRQLPRDIKNALLWRPGKAIAEWLRAKAILKQGRETNHG